MNQETRVLALYDCRSKQEYIYRTNRIREISGGSALLASLYEDFLAEAEKNDLFIQGVEEDFTPDFNTTNKAVRAPDGKIVYIGGGNLMILYQSFATYVRANQIFSYLTLQKTYSLSLVAACTQFTGNFNSDKHQLYLENKIRKNTDSGLSFCNTLPFTKLDRITYQPLTHTLIIGNNEKQLSCESYLKYCKYIKEQENNSNTHLLDEITTDHGRESILAIIYIDGNALGNLIMHLTDNCADYVQAAKLHREFSEAVNRDFVARPKKRIIEKLNSLPENIAKYRLVIGGGDEITLICNARAVPAILEAYFSSLAETNQSYEENAQRYACAGVALFHSHAPFSDVYWIAEQCCESGKKKARKNDSKVNYIDFHFCRAAIVNNMETIRDRQEKGLTARPYRLEDFKELLQFAECIKEIGRANIKQLSNALIDSESQYLFELERIGSRFPEFKKAYDSYQDQEQLKKWIFDIATVYDLWFSDLEKEGQEIE